MAVQERRALQCGPYVYYPDESLGQGSFAEVFKGMAPDGAAVAVKRIAKSKLTRPSNQRLLQSEIAILQGLRHPNIVQLLDNQETPDFICLVMEFCDGGDLGTYITQKAPMSEDMIASVVQQLVDALNYLSSKNIVHRDLKPQNILLQPGSGAVPTVKIADFGFARHLVQEDLAATFCGSPLYMAPEVLDGDSYNASADLWSVGTIIYQCLTGLAPFRAPNIRALKELLHATSGPLIPTTTSADLRALLNGLLRVDPAVRLTLAQLSQHPFLTSRLPVDEIASAAADTPPPSLPASTPESLGASKDIDDRSYVLIDPGYVEVNTLADSMERRTRAAATATATAGAAAGRSPADLVAMLEAINSKAGVIIGIANNRLLSQSEGVLTASVYTQSGRVQARAEALLLFVKGLSILRAGLGNLRGLIGRNGIAITPALSAAVNGLRSRFNDCAGRIETIREELAPSVMHAIKGSAEQLLYRHAITLSRDAATKEARANFASSEVLYHSAVVLLEIVLADARDLEYANVQSLLQSLRERHQVVAQRSASQATYHATRPPLAPTREDPGADVVSIPIPQGSSPRTAYQASPPVHRQPSPGMRGPSPSYTHRGPSPAPRRQPPPSPPHDALPADVAVPWAEPRAEPAVPLLVSHPSAHQLGVSVGAARAPSPLVSPHPARAPSPFGYPYPPSAPYPASAPSVSPAHSAPTHLAPAPHSSAELLALAPPALPLPGMTASGSTPPGVSPGPSPGRKAAFCGNCGVPFNSLEQRFCISCGAPRAGLGDSTRISSSPS